MKRFEPAVTASTKGVYGGLAVSLVIVGIISYTLEAPILVSIVLALSGLLPLPLFLIPYKTRYVLKDDHLLCEWIFGKKKIPYNTIEEVKSFHMPLTSIRRFGISFIGGRYSVKGTGKFYAMFGGERDGLLIVSRTEDLYGGKIYVAPQRKDEFVRELKERTNAAFSLDKLER